MAEKTNGSGPKELTVETARALLKAREERRAQDCGAELSKLLAKYNCDLVGVFVFDPIAGGRVQISIRALPEGENKV